MLGFSLCGVAHGFTDSQNKFIELSIVIKDDFALLVTEFNNISLTLSTSVQYGLCNALNLQKQVYGANDSATCVVINDVPSREESCFIATCTTDNINYSISIRGEFKGESIFPIPFCYEDNNTFCRYYECGSIDSYYYRWSYFSTLSNFQFRYSFRMLDFISIKI